MKMQSLHLKKYSILAIFVISIVCLKAQDDEKDKRPVTDPFWSTTLIDNQTSVIPAKKGLQFVIHHRFGTFENGLTDLYGIYAPSNIRMGFNYGLTDKLMVGIGTEKNNKAQEILWKYNILEQTRSNSMPITLTYFGNMAIDASDKADFGDESQFKSVYRLSYFSQFIVSRKFSDRISLLIAPGFIHHNAADSIYQNQRITYTVGGKVNIYNNINLLIEYDNSFSINDVSGTQKEYDPEGNLGFAAEFVSGTHTFQVTLAQFREIVSQFNHSFNSNTLEDGWCLGFNITVRFY